jgi:hypothetical protein
MSIHEIASRVVGAVLGLEPGLTPNSTHFEKTCESDEDWHGICAVVPNLE